MEILLNGIRSHSHDGGQLLLELWVEGEVLPQQTSVEHSSLLEHAEPPRLEQPKVFVIQEESHGDNHRHDLLEEEEAAVHPLVQRNEEAETAIHRTHEHRRSRSARLVEPCPLCEKEKKKKKKIDERINNEKKTVYLPEGWRGKLEPFLVRGGGGGGRLSSGLSRRFGISAESNSCESRIDTSLPRWKSARQSSLVPLMLSIFLFKRRRE
jgi:hypothetical protein